MAKQWTTVRVFVSSTFRDMQAERDHLVRFVFPKLRQELLRRQIHFVDVDLRWGVTSEQDSLKVCKDVIKECRPRFLCMLGGRYGWMPHGETRSITADEIHYGVLDRDLTNRGFAYFYFRNPSVTAAMVEVTPGEFRETDGSHDAVALDELKAAITAANLQPFIYQAQWNEQSRRLIGLQEFGDRVYANLKQSIDREFGPTPGEKTDEFTAENAAMETFIEERVQRFVLGSRQPLLDELLAHANSTEGNGYVCLTGAPGSGKSALLAHLSRRLTLNSQPSTIVISHFVGASPGSTNVWRTLRRLCHELVAVAALTTEIPEDQEKLRALFPKVLQQASATKHIVILLDAINQFDSSAQLAGWWWLPEELPATARIILSTLSGPTLESLRQRRQPPRLVELQPLDDQDRNAIIKEFLQRYQKSIADSQRAALLAKADGGVPLYLLTALEELRTLSVSRQVTDSRDQEEAVLELIRQLPPSTQEMFAWILKRLEDDDGFRDVSGRKIGRKLVPDFVSLLGASRHGLSHQELVELLSSGDPQGNVAALTRLLRPYLMQRGELLDFYHGQFREAAERRYASHVNKRRLIHARLATYFLGKGDPHGDGTWPGTDPRGRNEFPLHFLRSQPEPEALNHLFTSQVPADVCRSLCTLAALEMETRILRRAFLASRDAVWQSASAGFLILARADDSVGAIALAEALREAPFLRGLLRRPGVTIAKQRTLLLTTLDMWFVQHSDPSIMDPLHSAWKDKLANAPLLGRMLRWRSGRRFLAWGAAFVGAMLLRKVPDIWAQNAEELNCSFGDPVPELEAAVEMFKRRSVQVADEETLARLADSRDVLTVVLLQNILIAAAEKQPEAVAGIAQRLFDRCMKSQPGQIPMATQSMLYVMDRLLQGIEDLRDGRQYYAQFAAMLSAYLKRDERYYECRVKGRTYKATFIAALLTQHHRWHGSGLPTLYQEVLARASATRTPRVDRLRVDILQDLEIVGVSTNDPSLAFEALRPIIDAGWWKEPDKCPVILQQIIDSIGRRNPRLLEKEMSGWPFVGEAISKAPATAEDPFQTLFFAIDREVLRQPALREAISNALHRGIVERSLRAFVAASLINLLALFDRERYGNA